MDETLTIDDLLVLLAQLQTLLEEERAAGSQTVLDTDDIEDIAKYLDDAIEEVDKARDTDSDGGGGIIGGIIDDIGDAVDSVIDQAIDGATDLADEVARDLLADVGTLFSADDLLTFTDLDDQILGTIGADALFGLGGDDDMAGGTGFDSIDGAEGDDLLRGQGGQDTLVGGDGDDDLRGGNGDDILVGGAGTDMLIGGNGADTLSGGAGNDSLTGGRGGDVFVFGDSSGFDQITDFARGDQIDLTAAGVPFSRLVIGSTADGDTLIVISPDSSITLSGFDGVLSAEDFLF